MLLKSDSFLNTNMHAERNKNWGIGKERQIVGDRVSRTSEAIIRLRTQLEIIYGVRIFQGAEVMDFLGGFCCNLHYQAISKTEITHYQVYYI